MLNKTKVEFITSNGLKFVKETNEMGMATYTIDDKEVDYWELDYEDRTEYSIKIKAKTNAIPNNKSSRT